MSTEPNLEEFLAECKISLTPYQKELADALINYRVKHFQGGLRMGRTTVVNAVDEYMTELYPRGDGQF